MPANPASDQFHLDLDVGTFEPFEITDPTGRIVLQEKVYQEKIAVDCSGWKPGIYWLRTYDSESGSAVKKLILE